MLEVVVSVFNKYIYIFWDTYVIIIPLPILLEILIYKYIQSL